MSLDFAKIKLPGAPCDKHFNPADVAPIHIPRDKDLPCPVCYGKAHAMTYSFEPSPSMDYYTILERADKPSVVKGIAWKAIHIRVHRDYWGINFLAWEKQS